MGEIREIKGQEFIDWAMKRFNWSKEETIKHMEEIDKSKKSSVV